MLPHKYKYYNNDYQLLTPESIDYIKHIFNILLFLRIELFFMSK